MFKLSKEQKQEIREYVEAIGHKYNVTVKTGNGSGSLKKITLSKEKPKFRFVIALDDEYFDNDCDMTLFEIETFEELKKNIEKIIFEITAYGYLVDCLYQNMIEFNINTDEFGQFLDCEIFGSPDSIIYDFFLEFYPEYPSYLSTEDNETCISYTISSGDMDQMKTMVESSISELMESRKIIC